MKRNVCLVNEIVKKLNKIIACNKYTKLKIPGQNQKFLAH